MLLHCCIIILQARVGVWLCFTLASLDSGHIAYYDDDDDDDDDYHDDNEDRTIIPPIIRAR